MKELNQNHVMCMECGNKFKQITTSHLKNKHNMSIQQYNIEHNNPPLVCGEVNDKKSKSIKLTKAGKKMLHGIGG